MESQIKISNKTDSPTSVHVQDDSPLQSETAARIRRAELVARLTRLDLQARAAREQVDLTVQELRAAGATWAIIGDALKISAQAAYQRWSAEGNEKHRIRQQRRLEKLDREPADA